MKVLPTEGFLKDRSGSGALVNVDNKALTAYKARRDLELSKRNEINNLKQEVDQIKSMLSLILEKLDK